MIKKLRKKFVTMAMIAVSAVLLTIIGIVNVANILSINGSADERLDLLCRSGGSFFPAEQTPPTPPDGETPPAEGETPPGLPDGEFDGRHGVTRETPYESRYFSVTFENGQIVATDLSRIASVDEAQAKSYAESVKNKGTKGYAGDFRYLKATIDGKETYLFLDCSRDLNTFRDFLLYSFLISIGGLAVVFVLVLFFSKRIVKPVAESYEKQKRFITDASHELKTPLTIISANTEILEMDVGENEWTESIKNQVARLTGMTNNLVYLSRMEEETPRLNMTDFSLSALVEDTAAPYEAIARAQGKSFSVEAAEGIHCHGDEKAIKQALTMLLDNAMKYSDENGSVRIELKEKGKAKVISVQNTVEEMPIGPHDELFERFARSDQSRNSKTGGSGIGMAVAKAVVLAHGGKISCQSPDGKSFVVFIEL